jgi:hypothetical protein
MEDLDTVVVRLYLIFWRKGFNEIIIIIYVW